MNVLKKIISDKRKYVSLKKAEKPIEALREQLGQARPTGSLAQRLNNSKSTGIIAEFKRKSPSKGKIIKEGTNLTEVINGYTRQDVAGISILTDEPYFGGHIDDLITGNKISSVPLLRKDFIIDAYQVYESRLAGADALLLIAAALDSPTLGALTELAHELNMEVICEVHNRNEINHIPDEVDIVGVNNRNLETFRTDFNQSIKLLPFLPKDKPRISESGISNPEVIRKLRETGFNGFLIGEYFMRHHNPAVQLSEMIKKSVVHDS